jgi:uncharacterized membrane protein YdjX (TVP38/TMEM64 family)
LRDWVRRRLGPQLEVIDRGIEEAGAFYLLMLRLNPFIPYFLVNAGMGLTRIRIWIFWVVSQLGMLPLTFLYLSAAVELARLESPAQVLTPKPLIFLALVSLVPLLLRFLFRGNRPPC